MRTLQTEMSRLSTVFGTVLLPSIHDDRYEIPEAVLAGIYGLGCTCWMQDMTVLDPLDGFTFGECECMSRSTDEQSASFVSLHDIRASVVREMDVRGMTPEEYDAWFAKSEEVEYASAPAYRSSGAPHVDLGYTEMEDEDYDAYMQEVAA